MPTARKTKTEHYGQLDRVIYPAEGTDAAGEDFAILALTDGHKVIVSDQRSRFARGIVYRFLGRWEEGPRGEQFRADTWIADRPASRSAVELWLSEHGTGIGAAYAGRLYEAFGTDAVRVLREEPDRVKAADLIPAEAVESASRSLAAVAGQERTRLELFDLLNGRGFPRATVKRAISTWGAKAPAVVRRDPFRLLTANLPGCGWKRSDQLYLDLGGDRRRLKRQSLAGWSAVRDDRSGSTWVPADVAVDAIRAAVPSGADPIKALKVAIRAGRLRLRRDGSRRWLALADRARAEQRIADAVARLRVGVAEWPNMADAVVGTDIASADGLPSDHQWAELSKAIVGPVGALTGGPGTGKTHTLAFLLRAIVGAFGLDSVAVCAPTGKAAVRASESLAARGLSIRATTIHRLLLVKTGGGSAGWEFEANRDRPLKLRFLVIDESSMIDASLLADLLDACATGTHVLFVGDPYQLPPVGHGAPLRDLIASGAIGVGELTEIRRNAGTVVRACAAIKAGRRVEPDARLDLAAESPANLKYVNVKATEAAGALEDLLTKLTKFDPVRDTQVIVALNEKGELSRKALNDRLQRLLNPNGKRVAPCPFAVGDKIICTKNGRYKSVVPIGQFNAADMAEDAGNYQPNCDREFDYIANGEPGFCVAVSARECVLTFDGGRFVSVPVKKQTRRDDDGDAAEGEGGKAGGLGDFELAYAITCHKSQGSEWPLVVAMIDPAGGAVADRHWWYTVISRTRTACVLIGDGAALAVQCARQSLAKRHTFLAELIRGEV